MAESGTVVAVAQLALAVGELDANREAARAAVAEAALAGARLVVLPELSDSGYVFSDPGEARSLASPAASGMTLQDWQSLAARHDLTIAGGFCELGLDGSLYNSAAIVDASGTRAVYRKAHLWDAEKKVFTPGDGAPPVVELPFGNIALMICYDLEFPERVRLAALKGADLIAVPVNWTATGSPAPAGERSGEVVAAQAAASCNLGKISVRRDGQGDNTQAGTVTFAGHAQLHEHVEHGLLAPGQRAVSARGHPNRAVTRPPQPLTSPKKAVAIRLGHEDIVRSNVPGKPRCVVQTVGVAAEWHRPQSLTASRRIPVLVRLKAEVELHKTSTLIGHAGILPDQKG